MSSFREGTHACAVDGKKSLSIFKFLGYNAASDTSLVECQPVTGRTHQLQSALTIDRYDLQPAYYNQDFLLLFFFSFMKINVLIV